MDISELGVSPPRGENCILSTMIFNFKRGFSAGGNNLFDGLKKKLEPQTYNENQKDKQLNQSLEGSQSKDKGSSSKKNDQF